MLSDFLTPFLELDEEFCKNFRGPEVADVPSSGLQRVLGFWRRHSFCPVTLPNSKFNSSPSEEVDASWGLNVAADQQWSGGDGRLPRCSLNNIPFTVDRSVSMIEGNVDSYSGVEEKIASLLLSNTSLSSSSSLSKASAASPPTSTRYKTELCRTYEESGTCKYGTKCQFAHGLHELRGLSRHPKYKTERCRTFHTIGFCPYGARCHFIHNADELQAPQRPNPRPPVLRHSVSFAGFSSSLQTLVSSFQPVQEPSSLMFTRASSVSPLPTSSGSPDLLSPGFLEPGALKHRSYPLSGGSDLPGDSNDIPPRFCAATDSAKCPFSILSSNSCPFVPPLPQHLPLASLQRCSSANSLSEEGYTSSCSLSSSSGSESPSFEGRRLPIFSHLSITDE